MRRRLLLMAGILLALAGAVTVALVLKVALGKDAGTGLAQDRLAAEFTEGQTAPTTSATTDPADDDPRMLTATTSGDESPGPTTTLPGLLFEPAPAAGGAVGRILIPAIAVDWMVVEGVSLDLLAQGPGHMPGTAMPGQPGNAVISGHRTTHGAPFFKLDALLPGDRITLQTLLGDHLYEVTEVRIVQPGDVWVTRDATGAWLTLTTCHPPTRSIERLVVFARLVAGPNYQAIHAIFGAEEAPPRPPGG